MSHFLNPSGHAEICNVRSRVGLVVWQALDAPAFSLGYTFKATSLYRTSQTLTGSATQLTDNSKNLSSSRGWRVA
jgi:hypothetical protein